MPEVQLTEPLDHAAEKGGFKEVLATVEAAVEADVEALLGPGRVEAQDFETLEQAVGRQALATAAHTSSSRGSPSVMPWSTTQTSVLPAANPSTT